LLWPVIHNRSPEGGPWAPLSQLWAPAFGAINKKTTSEKNTKKVGKNPMPFPFPHILFGLSHYWVYLGKESQKRLNGLFTATPCISKTRYEGD
jgi:hypothetical protein